MGKIQSPEVHIDPTSLALWVDATFLVVNKPSGLVSLPDGYDPDIVHLKSILEPIYGPIWIVHRLDRETSGVMVVARNADAHRSLNNEFERREVFKEYHALVCGSPPWQELSVRLPLVVDGDRRHRSVVDKRFGIEARTDLRVIRCFKRFALLSAHPYTGRRHQIRAHAKAVGYPIVGDDLYGGRAALYLSEIKPDYRQSKFEERPLLGRVSLHARLLRFRHPISSQELSFDAPYPKDIKVAIKQLEKYD